MVAYRLVDLQGRASAANILGITVRELDKLVEVFEISEKFTKLRDPSAAITWARELMGVSKKLLVPSVIDAVVKKVNQKRITNSKDLRKLRAILPDPVARAHFLSEEGDLELAQLRLRAKKKTDDGLLTDLELAVEAMNCRQPSGAQVSACSSPLLKAQRVQAVRWTLSCVRWAKSHDLALGHVPVAHQSPAAIIGQLVGMGAEPSRNLGFDGLLQ